MQTNLPTYKRKCDNWIASFRDWVLPRSEAPEQYIFWSGIFCIAAALRRKVIIPKRILGTWDCAPYMYMMFVGPAGMRKTTTARMGSDLMEPIPELPDPPTFISKEAMIDSLMKSPDSSMMLLIEEFSDIMHKSGPEMYEFLTSMFDGKKKIEQNTMKRGLELVDKPCVNMLAATTPDWLAANMPEALIGGGFASRVIWIYADELRNRGMYWSKASKKFDFAGMQDALQADLAHIAQSIEGEVEIPDDVQDQVEAWYQTKHVPQEKRANSKIAGYMRRKPVHLHKLAMILHFARTDSMTLEWRDFEAALVLLDDIQLQLGKVFAGVGKNPFSFDMRSIVQFVVANGKVTRAAILNEFANSAQPQVLEQLIQGCVASKNIKIVFDGKQQFYLPPDEE